MDKEIEVEVEPASGRKDPGWKYVGRLLELCREVVGKEKATFVLGTMCRTLS